MQMAAVPDVLIDEDPTRGKKTSINSKRAEEEGSTSGF